MERRDRRDRLPGVPQHGEQLGRPPQWLGLLGANTTSFDDTSAMPGTTYYYWVRSLTSASGTYYYSNFSTPDTGYALSIPPPVPTGLAASDGTYTNKVSLTWNDVTGESGVPGVPQHDEQLGDRGSGCACSAPM